METSYPPPGDDSTKIPPPKELFTLDQLPGNSVFLAMVALKALKQRKLDGLPDAIFRTSDTDVARRISHLDLCGLVTVERAPEHGPEWYRVKLKGKK